MNDFNLEVSLEENVLFIANENSTGATYEVQSAEDIGKRVVEYIENYCM